MVGLDVSSIGGSTSLLDSLSPPPPSTHTHTFTRTHTHTHTYAPASNRVAKSKIAFSKEYDTKLQEIMISFVRHVLHEAAFADWAQRRINFLASPQVPLLPTVQRQKLSWFGHVTRHGSLSKTILQSTVEVGDTVEGTGNARWTTSRNGHPCPCQKCSRWLPAEKTERRSLRNRPLCLLDDPVDIGSGLISSELGPTRRWRG